MTPEDGKEDLDDFMDEGSSTKDAAETSVSLLGMTFLVTGGGASQPRPL